MLLKKAGSPHLYLLQRFLLYRLTGSASNTVSTGISVTLLFSTTATVLLTTTRQYHNDVYMRKSTYNLHFIFKVIAAVIVLVVFAVAAYRINTTSTEQRSRASALRMEKSIFADVPKNSYAFSAIERIYRLGLTAGCSQNPLKFCPNNPVTRGEAAVFIVRALFGSAPIPPAAQPIFTDVPESHPFRAFIEKMYTEHLTAGCNENPRMYCPDEALSRRAMAVFLVRALHGTSFTPPPATGSVFQDVTMQTPFSTYIEQLRTDGMATVIWPGNNESNINCSGVKLSFCPYLAATRADMAIMLERLIDRPPLFADVPVNYWAFSSIQRIAREGITAGCSQSPKKYCPDDVMTRGAATVLMLRGKNGATYTPPPSPEGPFFADVPATHPFYGYIQQLYRDKITAGCSQNPLKFCPDDPLTRGAAATMLIRLQNGGEFQPPTATGDVFTDVRPTTMFADYIEAFYRDAITVGCSLNPIRFCPENPATRAAFAIFLDRLFLLD